MLIGVGASFTINHNLANTGNTATNYLVTASVAGGSAFTPLNLQVVLDVNGNGTRITYGANTLPGSSGAPVCTFDLELVAVHHAGSPVSGAERNEGIPITLITRHLRDGGHADLLGG